MSSDNPILNSPYELPSLHYSTDVDGSLDYNKINKGRRFFTPGLQAIPARQGPQSKMFDISDFAAEYGDHLVNRCRFEIGKWRDNNYPDTTRVTKELLTFWFKNPNRIVNQKLFFAQQEAIETAIWLNEVAAKSNAGQNIINKLRAGQQTASENTVEQLPRIAFKMATGTGKTVVMGCFILYHFFNRQEYRNDTRFADYFLIVTPGITIKDRLGVLFVDTKNKNPQDVTDYYRIRGLVPQNLEQTLQNLNARLTITNYHTFEPKILQGNKRSPFDGKVDLEGNKIDTGNTEDFSLVVKRALSKFKKDCRLLIMNDEAHHCYKPLSKGKTTDNEEVDENERAAVWFTGLKEISQRFKVQNVYDLSATPYYLKGSGYDAYSLFPWVVSDFGLIEAIESGLVKIPFLPESDNTHELSMPVLRNLYEHVSKDLPKKGQRKKKSEAAAEGTPLKEMPVQLPSLVKGALDQFYNNYVEYYNGYRKSTENKANLFSAPPVFIVVCNNTSVSKEIYKYIAGYEYEDEKGKLVIIPGAKDLFSNYDGKLFKPHKRPPTLLIDSDALDNSEQVNEDFRKIFATEIEEFKRDYAAMHGQGSVENITDAQILREVVNTVGKQNKLGSHIRCVVSVSMLTEGWDANTVTHIMGLRAFGSQLLCEQVAGRALRRMNYELQGYDKDGNPTDDKRKIVIEKFPPEYAHIIGVPFKMFKGGKTPPPPPPVDRTHIFALKDREEMEITFPNVVGYRMQHKSKEIFHDFSTLEDYEIDGTKYPVETIMSSPISPNEQKLKVKTVLEKRDNELIFLLTKELIKHQYSDDDGNREFQKFNMLKRAVTTWYNTKVKLLNLNDEIYKRLLFFERPEKYISHIVRGLYTKEEASNHIIPILNYYNKFGSTQNVNGNTVKPVYRTKKSHVNYVVADTLAWEQIAAKTLEELELVESYVKNAYLEFTIPYIKEGESRRYYPDFIAKVSTKEGIKNLIIEITGMNKDKAEKKWYVENCWLPAVNSMKEKYEYSDWHFVEVAGDIRNIKNELIDKITKI